MTAVEIDQRCYDILDFIRSDETFADASIFVDGHRPLTRRLIILAASKNLILHTSDSIDMMLDDMDETDRNYEME